jgi:glycopeptide antibiotics resistance protein
LTGLFGLYPCAFRTFEVDDLIFNISGLLAGFAMMRRWRT